MKETQPAAEGHAYAKSAAWFAVVNLSALYVISIVDRIIFVILADRISVSLTLSDAQMGLILGLAFAVVYSLAGLPLAHWLDTRSRKLLVAGGVVFWGAMTLLSSFANDFWTLLLCRSGLAFGEAVLTPAAISLIGDMFAKDRRTLPTSVYASIGGIFGTGAFTIGAVVVALAGSLALTTGWEVWRTALIILSVPTVLMGLFFALTVKEPPRQGSIEGFRVASMGEFLQFLSQNRRFYFPFYAGFGLVCCFNYGLVSWVPTIFLREYDVDPTESSFIFGMLGIVGGGIGSLIVPQFAMRIERLWPGKGITATLLLLSVLLSPVAIFMPLLDSPFLLYACAFFSVLFSSTWFVLGALAIQLYADGGYSARLMALYLLASSLFGLSIGPVALIGFAEAVQWAERPLSHGLGVLGLCTIPVAIVMQALAHRAIAGANSRVSP